MAEEKKRIVRRKKETEEKVEIPMETAENMTAEKYAAQTNEESNVKQSGEMSAESSKDENLQEKTNKPGRRLVVTRGRSLRIQKPGEKKPRVKAGSETVDAGSMETAAEFRTEAAQDIAAEATEERKQPEEVQKETELHTEAEAASVPSEEPRERVLPTKPCRGILEIMPENYGFIRSENFLPGESDVYVNPALIKRYGLKKGDIIQGLSHAKNPTEKYNALSFIETVNEKPLSALMHRRPFEQMTPIFPRERIRLEDTDTRASTSLRILDLLAPIGKGQRGMIVSPPKAGKTTLLKQVAKSIVRNQPAMHLLILLIDERPEEVTDMKEEVEGGNVQVIYSTFDETADHHVRVAEMTIERAKRLVEQGEDVTILLDSITRLTRAYNLSQPASGRTLSGGLDPAALHMPKMFFGAARNMREGGSLTILATALVDTGSRMDDVIYEEFKGTGNMELVLNRDLQERRIFPAIDILKSGTRRDDLLLTELEQKTVDIIHKRTADEKNGSIEEIISLFDRTYDNNEICDFLVNGKPLQRQGSRMVIKVNRSDK